MSTLDPAGNSNREVPTHLWKKDKEEVRRGIVFDFIKRIPRQFSFPDGVDAMNFVEDAVKNYLCNKVKVEDLADNSLIFVTVNVLAPGIDRLNETALRYRGEFLKYCPFFFLF